MTLREAMEQAFNFPHELGEVTNPLGLNSWPVEEVPVVGLDTDYGGRA